jgi:tryptophan halogenase
VEGFLTLLVGSQVPYRNRHVAGEAERATWKRHLASYRAVAQNGMDVKEALGFVKHPGWCWGAGK